VKLFFSFHVKYKEGRKQQRPFQNRRIIMYQISLQQTAKYRVLYFLATLIVFTAGAAILANQMPESAIPMLAMMWSPALAALTTSLLTRRSLKQMGWGLGPLKWLAIAWILPIAYGLFAYAPLWISGLGSIPNPTFLERARLTLNMGSGSNTMVILSAFGFITLVNLIPSMIFSLGEEIGWRGLLVPELSKWMSVRKAGLLSGVIWAAWHLPGILSGDYGAETTPLAFRLACFILMVISSSLLFAWIRMRSGSLWPAVILHAVHNNVIQAFYDRITADTGYTRYFAGEFGAALAIVMLIIAVLVWKKLGQTEKIQKEIPSSGSLAGI
jgi:membrane protease YdiL (CAAX protease family)